MRSPGIPARLTRSLAAALIVGAVALVGTSYLPVATHQASGTVTGYPQRVDYAQARYPLPAKPGAMAAIILDNNFGNARYLAVSEWGKTWDTKSQGRPALSPDGTLLLGIWGDVKPSLRVRNLVTGTERSFPQFGVDWTGDANPTLSRYRLSNVSASWSPDGRTVLLDASRKGRRLAPIVLNLSTDAVTEIAVSGVAAGWLSASEVVTVHNTRDPGNQDRFSAVRDHPD